MNKIATPKGMEITPEDIKRGAIEVLATFEVSEDGSELELKDIDSFPVEEAKEAAEEELEEPVEEPAAAAAVPSEDETIMGFVQGEMAKQAKKK